jgi:parallel beta-helix repeat protein
MKVYEEVGVKRVVTLVMAIAALLLCGTAHATIWYVHPDSTFNCIQDCMDSCTTGDTVLVGPGLYIENITWPNTDSIYLVGEYGRDTTIIDGDSAGIVISITTGVDSATVINGFTIQNGAAYDAGGIHCDNYSSPTISDNIITGNVSGYGGGGIECYWWSSPVIRGNTITNNITSHGGGIECWQHCSPTITDNIIRENTGVHGGGIACITQSSPIIMGNTIELNTTDSICYGGGIYCYSSCSPTIVGNIINSNTATYGGGISCYSHSSPTIRGNTITSNTADSVGGGIDCWNNSSPVIKYNTIVGNIGNYYAAGIGCMKNCAPSIDSCIISENYGNAVYCDTASIPVIHYCNIANNTGYGVINIDSTVTVNAESNWWGDASGPYHPVLNDTGQGDSVSDHVDFEPWLTDSVQWIGVEEHQPSRPVAIALQIIPNPFRNRVSITFSVEHDLETTVFTIYNVTGRVVKEFNHLTNNQILWNGTDNLNRRLPSGVYFVKFQAGEYSTTEKLLLIR